jgi:ribonuclease HI
MIILNDKMGQPEPRLNTLLPMPCPSNYPDCITGLVGPPILGASRKRLFVTNDGARPGDIFKAAINYNSIPNARWVYIDKERKSSVLVFTDGAALGSGKPGARGGCGIVFGPFHPGISFPLERASDDSDPTSNRAELRAVLGAVTMRVWYGEGFSRLVIGTDSEYVVKGISEWCMKWKGNGWKTSSGTYVRNQDLWRLLLVAVEALEAKGFSVQFFQLKREWNQKADACAKKGAVSLKRLLIFFYQVQLIIMHLDGQ